MNQPCYAILEHRAVLSLAGPDVRGFLQGIVSNDVERVSTDHALWTAFLTPQGKFLHEFFLVERPSPEDGTLFWLECEAERRAEMYPDTPLVIDAGVAGAYGGTGQAADWTAAARLARSREVWLAGGLRPDNVAAAVDAVQPFGVDVSSGVEAAPGRKDHDKLDAFARALEPYR